MITKYITYKHRNTEITKKEYTRETEKSLFYVYSGGLKKDKESVVRKESEYYQYHNTFEEARQYLQDRINKKIEYHNSEVIKLEKEFQTVSNITEEK